MLNTILAQSFDIPSQHFDKSPPLHACHFCHTSKAEKLQILAFRNHPATTAWMYAERVSKEAHLHFIEQLQHSQNAAYYLFKRGLELLGVGSLTRIDFAHNHAFLGIYKNPDLEHVGTLILDGLEFIAFFKLGLHTLHLEVMANNTRAIGFYERHSYRKGGFLRDFVCRQDTYYDVWLFSKISPLDKGLK
ncbi:UDP-4-amino-4,6-dideoxy-N-acetyl-beta-L-altrosamine N-acetyltransferase [Helicobacter ailurogastricus]|uniref:UDP-4-amino-4, 6-dideoxy-N-acetyl-beta-L-altrosamine N-acetyltransferase n=1 Tax=Helicobacter ailurogastricus TaxID=1578720 RepID=UPI0022C32DE7|nr:UDP-4-amino-4,6-dideoxy-N-acetyl-beta-L-altrosamine N-acetyltransferase [Helicobacter ailurogastricus]GLH57772.1 UDP-4-amino-4,6-dideoxy-N-acetyl-beta-L-altrosami ne N-acetyltransferase PseH [Helicobacter ailurogastricus]GLH59248.1 UDP-4-amino-4,6-dideoxy-N-acetyl-beta-L-altrosami ne N-acetyltransferase PseH [Helicobacter ailurogastricus]GMB91150.1 UDP-4-amino-4,6-dideoxy-N-acetyl-beta-L-altrosami ne N-acetyltransferase PseH [Helicobacter ailurogastricus]